MDRLKQRDQYVDSRNISLAELNASERALCGQLMLITSVLISANLVVYSDFARLQSMAANQKVLIVVGFSLLIVSIGSGIKNYFDLISFHIDWAKGYNDVVNLLGKAKDTDVVIAVSRVNEILSSLKQQSSVVWLRLQVIFLFLALFAYFILVIAVLFDLRIITVH